MWERVAEISRLKGQPVLLGRTVTRIEHDRDGVKSVTTRTADGDAETHAGTHFISSIPIRELVSRLDPPAPERVRKAAESLSYRDFISIALMIDRPNVFPDNWIYIHDPGVRVGRIQNFKNWSPDMVPDQGKTCLGLEYFCFEGDGMWTMSDADLVQLGRREIEAIGLARSSEVIDGCVVRMPKAYPVYDDHYKDHLAVIRGWLRCLSNLELAGRNGMHKYNNQDHSMMTALLAARNILGLGSFDTWKVNTDAEYHEGGTDEGAAVGRAVPRVIEAA
jgi:protoporphyrinogen oxidase